MGDKVKIAAWEVNGVEKFEREERDLSADIVEIDNTSNGYVGDDVAVCLEEGDRKRSGTLDGTLDFAGNPKTATVTFSSNLPDANYVVTIIGEDSRVWSIENKTASGFDINANANQVLLGDVYWKAEPIQDIG